MAQRSADDVARVLRQRPIISYFGGEDSEEEIDNVEEADSDDSESHVSDKQSEEDESVVEDEPETVEGSRRRKFVYGKDKHQWCLTTPESRGRRSNITIILPKVIGAAARSRTILEIWSTLFTQDILNIVLKYTNAEIERFIQDNNDCASFQPITLNELKAFIGLLYFGGMQNNNRVNLTEIWSREFGSKLHKATMSQRRFEFISCRLRFDDKATRSARRLEDALAPIRQIWDIFIQNCQNNYTPSQFLTIDEQLLGFRGRFSGRVYIKSKPARYGIKIVSMNDAKTFYMYNAIPYTGKVQTEQGESVPSYYVRKLSEPIHNTHRNITCDNWFTSVEICNKMKKNFNISMVGTLRKNKRQIPESFKRNVSIGAARMKKRPDPKDPPLQTEGARKPFTDEGLNLNLDPENNMITYFSSAEKKNCVHLNQNANKTVSRRERKEHRDDDGGKTRRNYREMVAASA
ncbi:piggyBac transposable element-derived protein 4-like [Onthophagus taurus]|uniref:piggyBac transposable element-derived protein 4-like n=1 Tax=Onthophagus taurus TaxID=166361 RepID=UPI0039BE1DBD